MEAKHATKHVDRLLSNLGVDVELIRARWVELQLREVEEAWVNLDWTDAEGDDPTTPVASLQEDRGRSTPLMWTTVRESELEDRKLGHVETLLTRLRAAVPSTAKRTFIVADREFGNRRMYTTFEELGFDDVLRFRQDVHVTSWDGETRKADWQRATGKRRSMMSASITTAKTRQHSLLKQGLMGYDFIPTMREEQLCPLMEALHEVAHELRLFGLLAGVERRGDGSAEGGHRWATLLGVVRTAQKCDVDVFGDLTWMFGRRGSHRKRFGMTDAPLTPMAYRDLGCPSAIAA